MTRRSYDQFCGLAKALDLVGERWTLLLVRELMLGPRRFTDLQQALPGLGTSLLSARLKQLEEIGAVRRDRLPPPAASTVYELTELGAGLAPAVRALAGWGMRLLPERPGDEVCRPEWLALYRAAAASAEAAEGPPLTCEIRVGEETLHIRAGDGRAQALVGRAPYPPDLSLAMDRDMFLDLALGRADLAAALTAGQVTSDGDADPAVVARAGRILAPADVSKRSVQ